MTKSNQTLKSLSWQSISSKIGDLGKAVLPAQMTVGEVQSLLNTSIKLDGKDYRIGAVNTYRGNIQITAFPSNGNGSSQRTMQVG